MGKRLERFGEVRIVDETNGFGLEDLLYNSYAQMSIKSGLCHF